jgi:hypothetical protein
MPASTAELTAESQLAKSKSESKMGNGAVSDRTAAVWESAHHPAFGGRPSACSIRAGSSVH